MTGPDAARVAAADSRYGLRPDDPDGDAERPGHIPYEEGTNDKRFQVNGTWSFLQNHTVKGSYTWREREFTNNTYETVMDRASFYDSSQPEKLISASDQHRPEHTEPGPSGRRPAP